MTRSLHLERRGTVYYVRVRIPSHLTVTLGKSDFRRSLGTRDFVTARWRCNAAVVWFEGITRWMEKMGSLDRLALEKAANHYLAELIRDVDQPRSLPDHGLEMELAFQIEATSNEIEAQENRLISGDYTNGDRDAAREMLEPMGMGFDDLTLREQADALKHVVRATRQQMRFLLHSLSTPASRFVADDDLFIASNEAHSIDTLPVVAPVALLPEITLERGASMYIDYQVKKGWQGSMRDEGQRVLGWMREKIAKETPVSEISREQMRDFRDDLLNLKKGSQGKKLTFAQRIASPEDEKLKFVTRERYWRSTRSLFRWLRSEYGIPDPTEELLFEGKQELRQSPEPFSTEELREFLATPIFSGYKSKKRMKSAGDCHLRQGHWWSVVLMMFTGLRAGDIAQLMPTDFFFDHPVPHLLIQPGMLPDGQLKESKFKDRTHLIPLHPSLLKLGLREFVEARLKQNPQRRTLYEIRLGKNRRSAALSKFWGRYLREFNLHKAGRGPHTFRHTFAALLRSRHVSDDDIGALLGHSPSNVTASYGGPQDPQRKQQALTQLDFGFDVVAMLGGEYSSKRHRY